MVEEARRRESPVPEIERPFAVPMNPTLLLKRVKSTPERAPVVVVFAVLIVKRPVLLLYVRGQLAERFVRLILVATIPERVVTFPERVLKLVVRFERLALVVVRFPEREAISPVAVARLEFVVARLVVREFRLEFRDPESVLKAFPIPATENVRFV